METLIIDAVEKQDVFIFDAPGAYLHSEITEENKFVMKIKGEFVVIFL